MYLPTIPESKTGMLNTPIKKKMMITSTSFDEGGSTTNKRKRQRYLSQLKARQPSAFGKKLGKVKTPGSRIKICHGCHEESEFDLFSDAARTGCLGLSTKKRAKVSQNDTRKG